ncbi:dolichyl-phosphate beta-glucosyltransferase isoform X3 [Apteryx rowi]|uniref:dolichyl-phosphate beta-glucosyltransferase isoform X3 n=1 Tax=Apteryx rowi TaxID=308060 RepID=UPI000E1CB1B8|nr:dolichyl-phosphate beta-glucosyltransferase isoform X3 [Apteryx rowi]
MIISQKSGKSSDRKYSHKQICMIAHITAIKMPTLHRHEEEKFFITAEGRKESVPSIHDPPTRELSVVVPSYNEEDRLPLMMDEALDYLEKRQKQDPSFTYEVIVVDDGSKDQTTKVALKYCEKYGSDKVRVLSLVKNRGKGGAVRMGVFSSRGEKILMADADGATKFPDIEKVEEGLQNLQPWPNQMAISCGSRAHLEKESIAKRSYFRTLLMYGFHFLVWFLCVKEIRDTQCGFKLLTREAAAQTFSTLHIERCLCSAPPCWTCMCGELFERIKAIQLLRKPHVSFLLETSKICQMKCSLQVPVSCP